MRISKRGMSVDHASAVAAPKSDPVFLHVKAGMTVIVTDTDGAWRMADVIWVDGGARNPKIPTLFQVADVDSGVIRWGNADCVQRVCLPIKSPLTKLTELDGSGPTCSASWALS